MAYDLTVWRSMYAMIAGELCEVSMRCEMTFPFVPFVGLRYRVPRPKEFDEKDTDCLEETISEDLLWDCDDQCFVDFLRGEWGALEERIDKEQWIRDTVETFERWGWSREDG